jgi:TonB family protein
MRPNSSSAIFTSLILHGFVAAIIFVTTIYLAHSTDIAPKIIELVAGPPTAMDALEAPALGNRPDPVKVNVPKVELPPEPQVEQTPAVPEPVVKETVPAKPEPAKPEAVKTPTPPKAKSDTSFTKQMKKSEKTSYKEYLKKHPTPKQSAASTARSAAKAPKVDYQGIAKGVAGGSTANTRGGQGGKAMTREETDQLSTYISFLIQELKRAHEPPAGVSDRLEADVAFDITSGGAILNPRIAKSSGNREFDESVLEAFRRMRSIGPTPTRRPYSWSLTFKMRDEA